MSSMPDQQSNIEERVGRRKGSLPGSKDASFLVPMATLCETLDLPLKWVRRETSAGRVPTIRVGQRVLFNVQAGPGFFRERGARQDQKRAWGGHTVSTWHVCGVPVFLCL